MQKSSNLSDVTSTSTARTNLGVAIGTNVQAYSSELQAISSSGNAMFKNRIINGAMVIDQRNAGASVTNIAGSVYTLDRWQAAGDQASKFTIQQSSTASTGFVNSLVVTSSSAYSVPSGEAFILRTKIEGLNIADLGWGTASASAVTLSFWIRSSLTGTFGGALANSGSSRTYPFSYTVSSANTWEQKTITIAGDTSGTWLTTNGLGIEIRVGLGVGSTLSGTSGAWSGTNYYSATGATSVVGTSGATFYITGVQLEKGSTATSFDYRPYGTELALCQRYYQQINGNGGYSFMGMAQANATTASRIGLSFQQPMRAQPSFSCSAAGTFTIANASGNLTLSAISLGTSSLYGAWIGTTTSTTVAGYAGLFLDNGSSSAYLGFSAEL